MSFSSRVCDECVIDFSLVVSKCRSELSDQGSSCNGLSGSYAGVEEKSWARVMEEGV